MSTPPKQSTQPVRPTTPPPPVKKTVKTPVKREQQTFLFDRDNYILMIAGILLIFIGFQLMSGGKSPDPTKFNYDEIYSFRRITLSPIVIVAGFVVEVFAIMRKPKAAQTTQQV